MESDNGLSLSMIIPVHDGGLKFAKCLDGVVRLNSPPDEIIVVADGCTDGEGELAEKYGMKVLRTPRAMGPARARNMGSSAASGTILCFVDADVIPAPDVTEKILSAFQNDPHLTAVIGSYDDEPFEPNFISQYKNLFHHFVHQQANGEASTFWGACGAMRRRIFIETGGFDESYKEPSIEDIELGYRLKRAGYRIRLLKEVQVKHMKRWGVYSLLKTDIFKRALPWTELILAEDRFISDLNLKASHRLSVFLAGLFVLTLLAVAYWPAMLGLAGLLMLGIVCLNWDLYRFFYQKRGWAFTFKCLPWHWLYYGYCGVAFVLGWVKYNLKSLIQGRRQVIQSSRDKAA